MSKKKKEEEVHTKWKEASSAKVKHKEDYAEELRVKWQRVFVGKKSIYPDCMAIILENTQKHYEGIEENNPTRFGPGFRIETPPNLQDTLSYIIGVYPFLLCREFADIQPVSTDFPFVVFHKSEFDEEGYQIHASIETVKPELKPMKMRSKWMPLSAVENQGDAGNALLTSYCEGLRNEIDYFVASRIWKSATPNNREDALRDGWVFPKTPAGIAYSHHKEEIAYHLHNLSARVAERARGVYPNFIIASSSFCRMAETTRAFIAAPRQPGDDDNEDHIFGGLPLRKLGILAHKWVLYEASLFGKLEKDKGIFILGHRGKQRYNTGYILAPHLLFARSPKPLGEDGKDIDDFIERPGMFMTVGEVTPNPERFSVCYME